MYRCEKILLDPLITNIGNKNININKISNERYEQYISERYAYTYLLQHPELFKDNIIPSQLLNKSSNDMDKNFKDHVLNALKN
jgi:hypothetical protein